MSYLADGLNAGFGLGFSAGTQKKRDKKATEDQLLRDAAQIDAQRTLQNERLVAEAARDFENRNFQSAESQLTRELRMKEASDARGFQSGESQKDREQRLLEQANGFTQQRLLDEARRVSEGAQFGQTLDFNKQKFAWEQDPANPENVSRAAYADALRAKSGVDYYGPDPVPAQGANPRPGTIVEQNGQRYRFDGKTYVPIK
jgi:hypothetical protein